MAISLETRAPRRFLKRHKGVARHPAAAYLLLSPALVLYLAFVAIPLVALVVVSFLQWDLISPAHLTGLSNYREVAHDPELGQTLSNTF
jgi:multiple sugar transport system permease protein